MTRFLHTADLQIGMPFNRVPGDRGARLREVRLEAIGRLGELARSQDCEFVLVAGDLFDANTLEDRVVIQACDRLAEVALPVYAIPGNHDHCGGPDSIFRREVFRRHQPENLHVLTSREPVPILDARVLLLPAPLRVRSEAVDPTGHLDADLGRSLAPEAVRIGLAHGSVIDFDRAAEGGAAWIDPRRARLAQLDYLALGDWHGLKQIDEHSWYSGTPEPTSYKDNDPGHALVVSIEAHGAPCEVEPHALAATRWIRHALQLDSAADVERLRLWFEGLAAPRDSLVRLELSGSLSLADQEQLEALLRTMSGRLIELRRRGAGIVPRPAASELEAIASDGFVKLAVDRLSALAAESDGRAAPVAADALALLYRLNLTEAEAC